MPRGIWNGTLSFGLVAVPVRLVSAVRDRDVHFHQVDEKTGERIEIRRICEADGKEVALEEIGRGYQLDGQLVTLSDEELATAAPEHTHMIEIEEFVDLDAIDPAQLDRSYFLVPSSGSAGVTRAYRLLRDAVARTNQVAIGRVVIRSNEYLVAVRERDGLLSLTTMLFADELRGPDEIDAVPTAEAGSPVRGEVAAAVKLIDAMTREFEPDRYEDAHRQRLLGLIERKSDPRRAKVLQPKERDEPDRVPDLMAALKESLARARES